MFKKKFYIFYPLNFYVFLYLFTKCSLEENITLYMYLYWPQPTKLHTAYNLKTNDKAMPYFNRISEVQRRGMHFFGVNITTCVDFRNKE